MRTALVVIGPVPPPIHGVTISTSLIVASPQVQQAFDVTHIDTSHHVRLDTVGKWSMYSTLHTLADVGRLQARLRHGSGIVYLPLSQTTVGVLRDCVFIRSASARGWPVAAHLRGSEFREFYHARGRVMRRWIASSLRAVSSVAVMGKSLTGVFDGVVPSDRIAVVPNGTPSLVLDDIPRNGGLGLVLGNRLRRKGPLEALQAALLVLRENPSARFVFAGGAHDASLERQLRETAEPAGDRIVFKDVVTGEERRRLLGEAGFLIFCPIEPEGHPRVVLEALAAGLPVVTTDRGAIKETIGDSEAGFVLDHPEPAALAAAINRLLREPGLRERMSAAALARHNEHYRLDVTDRRFVTWLQGLEPSARS